MSKTSRATLGLLLLLLVVGTTTLLVNYLTSPNPSLPKTSIKKEKGTTTTLSSAILASSEKQNKKYPSEVQNISKVALSQGLPAVAFARTNDQVIEHINKVLNYIYKNVHPDTRLGYSLPGDKRLCFWSVVYDDAMRAMVHLKTDDVATAKKTIDYFIDNSAITKVGWVEKNGKKVARSGWTVNIVDAAETRIGGRGIEHIAHTGPNAYLGIAAIHLYHATGEKKYLNFARNRWSLLKDLQNEDSKDFNFGGIRMGPMGNPDNPQEQRLDFKKENPSFYEFYNGEHAADYKALCDLLARVDQDPERVEAYQRSSAMVSVWDKKIYDKSSHLFYIGTTEKRYFEPNIGQWVGPGVIKMKPLDTNALKINAYGVRGMEIFESNGAEKVRKAIDDHFKVTVNTKIGQEIRKITGYDFIAASDRKRLILFEEEGLWGDVKVKKGIGREPLLTDEWSTWVAMADLRMAKDFINLNQKSKAAKYWEAYKRNAFGEGLRSADFVPPNALAYPYAHPIPSGFNKPVGFGWNTHHTPYSLIGGVARIMGIMGFDPFSLDATQFTYKRPQVKFKFAQRNAPRAAESLITEAEIYINQAWHHVAMAQKHGPDEEDHWRSAAQVVERMLSDHSDWCEVAVDQNKLAQSSGDKFPLIGLGPLTHDDLEPVYRKYWALYHIGTGQFIRVMSYSRVAAIAKKKNDKKKQWEAEAKVKEAALSIVKKYYYSQAFDDSNGWMWQPVNSLKEYVSPNVLKAIEGYQFVSDVMEKSTHVPTAHGMKVVSDQINLTPQP